MVVIQNGLSLDHAWLESAAGAVDATPVYAAMKGGACTYIAGPRWTLDAIHALFTSGQDEVATPVLGDDFTTTRPVVRRGSRPRSRRSGTGPHSMSVKRGDPASPRTTTKPHSRASSAASERSGGLEGRAGAGGPLNAALQNCQPHRATTPVAALAGWRLYCHNHKVSFPTLTTEQKKRKCRGRDSCYP